MVAIVKNFTLTTWTESEGTLPIKLSWTIQHLGFNKKNGYDLTFYREINWDQKLGGEWLFDELCKMYESWENKYKSTFSNNYKWDIALALEKGLHKEEVS